MFDVLAGSEWVEITWRTLVVSGLAIAAAVMTGIPVGTLLATTRFRAKSFLIAVLNTGMGLPPVVVGLIVALALFRGGPLGFLSWMYTVPAMVLAQTVIAFPLVAGR